MSRVATAVIATVSLALSSGCTRPYPALSKAPELSGWYANRRGDTVLVFRESSTTLRYLGLGRLSGTLRPRDAKRVDMLSIDQAPGAGILDGSILRGSDTSEVGGISFGPKPEEHDLLLTRVDGDVILREEFRFTNDSLRFSGVLLHPQASAPAPAVVFIHGTGESTSDRPFEMRIARTFLRRGFAVLLFDKRGSGQSTGDWRTAGLADLASDVVAAIGALRARPDIRGDKIGVYGVSEGGWIAPLVNQRIRDLAFMVNHGGPGVDPLEDEADDLRSGIAALRLDTADAAAANEIAARLLDVYRSPGHFPAYQAAIRRVADAPWFRSVRARLPVSEDNWEIGWWRKRTEISPLAAWRARRAPSLVVIGSKDETMNVAKTVAAFTLLARTGPSLTLRVLPGASHGAQVSLGPDRGFDFAPGFPDLAADWALRLVR